MNEQISMDFHAAFERNVNEAMTEPRARRTDPVTSHLAAASAKDLAKQHQILILGALGYGPAGVDRIAALTKLSSYQVSKRMSELGRSGAARLTGRTVQSISGRAQREWERA